MTSGLPSPESLLPLPTSTFHILVALSGCDRHGYAILQAIEAQTDGKLRMSAGTLYRSVARMLEQGLIRELRERPLIGNDDERRRYYGLTDHGRSVARAEAARLSELVDLARGAGLSPQEA